MENRETKYWIAVASKDNVENGVAEGIAQACHGKASPLRRMQKGDFTIYYSSKQTIDRPKPYQQFTAIGEAKDEQIYHFQVSADFCPSRRNIKFLPSKDVSILPLLSELEFIKDKKIGVTLFGSAFSKLTKMISI